MHRIRTAFACLSLLALTACAALGLSSPQSFDERLAYAVTTTSAVYDSIAVETRDGRISPDDAEDLVAIADRARDLLISARRIHDAGQEAEASRQLALALAIVTEIQRYSQEE